MMVSGQLQAPTALPCGELSFITHRIRDFVEPYAYAMEKGMILPFRESNLFTWSSR